MLRVRWKGELFDNVSDANVEQYGLAWNVATVPEPSAALLWVLTGIALVSRRLRA
jgi:hypothetical protein